MRTSVHCPRTAAKISINLQDDRQTVLEGWNESLSVKCPHCGGVHSARYADLYIEGVMTGVGQRDLEGFLRLKSA